jgi:hypothetical protein
MQNEPKDEEIKKMNIKDVNDAKEDNLMHDDQGNLLEENSKPEDKKEPEE